MGAGNQILAQAKQYMLTDIMSSPQPHYEISDLHKYGSDLVFFTFGTRSFCVVVSILAFKAPGFADIYNNSRSLLSRQLFHIVGTPFHQFE